MGKHGAFELNYSSDIDISFFFEPEALPVADGRRAAGRRRAPDPARVASCCRSAPRDGYVFRVDLRLRPDPSSTPPAVPVAGGARLLRERRPELGAGGLHQGARRAPATSRAAEAFLEELQPFIWRRNLDFAAIADIHSIKRQIHVHKVDERLTRQGRRPEAGPRRHPRDRVLRPDPAADPGRPRPGAAQPTAPWTRWPPWPRPATSSPEAAEELADGLSRRCARSSTASR